jgi:hypothetical protein
MIFPRYNEALNQNQIRLLTDMNSSQTPEPVFYSVSNKYFK